MLGKCHWEAESGIKDSIRTQSRAGESDDVEEGQEVAVSATGVLIALEAVQG